MRSRIIEQLEAGRADRRRRRLVNEAQEINQAAAKRSQSLPAIRIVTTFADEEEEEPSMRRLNLHPSRRQHECQEEDELQRLRAQIKADTQKKIYSMSALQHEHDAAFARVNSGDDEDASPSRVTAQRAIAGPPTVPDSATFVEQERVMRRFQTTPTKRPSPFQPVQLHLEMEEEEEQTSSPNAPQPKPAETTSRLFCGLPDCAPKDSKGNIPGIEMQESFRSMFEPLNDRARQFFGKAKEQEDGTASAITEPFDNRTLQRNQTWTSVQDYIVGSWSFQRDINPKDTPTSVTHVPGETVSPVASADEMDPDWDAKNIAQRMEDSLKMVPPTILEEDNATAATSKDATNSSGPTIESTIPQIPSFCMSSEPPPKKTPKHLRTKFASDIPKEGVETKPAATKIFRKPSQNDTFWEDLLAEGVIDREDLSTAASSGVGVEIVNVDE